MPKYIITAPDGSNYEVNAPDDASEQDVMAYVQQNYQQASPRNDRISQIEAEIARLQSQNPADDMSFMEQVSAGAGKAVHDVGLGIGQLTGLTSQKEIDQAKKYDAGLMDTAGGITGNVAGNVAMTLIPGGAAAKYGSKIPKIGGAIAGLGKLVTTPQGLLPNMAGGAILAGTQPVASDENRLAKTAVGAAAGGLVPAIIGAGSLAKTLGYDMWTDDFAQKTAGKVLNRSTSGSAEDLIARISAGNNELVKGYKPTLAEALSANGNSDVGIATLQNVMQSADPVGDGAKAMIRNRVQEQNSALLRNLDDYILDDVAREQAKAARRAATSDLYNNLPTVPNSPELEKMLQTPAAKKAIPLAKEIAGNQYRTFGDTLPDGSVGAYAGRDLQSILQGMKATAGDPGLSAQMRNSYSGPLRDFSSYLENVMPELQQANKQYAELSKPLNQSDIFSALKNTQAVGLADTANERLQTNQFLSLLENEKRLLDKAGDLTGVTTLNNAVSPEGMGLLQNMKNVLRTRNSAASDAGSIGSPTAQNLIGYDLVASGLNALGLPENWAGNKFIQQTLERPSKYIFSIPESGIKGNLAKSFVDPEFAGLLSQKALKKSDKKLLNGLLKYQLLPAVSAGSYVSQQ